MSTGSRGRSVSSRRTPNSISGRILLSYLDATVAYRRACLNAIAYLKTLGYTGEWAYLLLGSAPIKGRISGIVEIPNACCSLREREDRSAHAPEVEGARAWAAAGVGGAAPPRAAGGGDGLRESFSRPACARAA
jgi:hypothetical protein